MEKVLVNIFAYFDLSLSMSIDLDLLEERYEELLIKNPADNNINYYYLILKNDIKRADWIFNYLNLSFEIPDDFLLSLFELSDHLQEEYHNTYLKLVHFFDNKKDYKNAYLQLFKLKRINNLL